MIAGALLALHLMVEAEPLTARTFEMARVHEGIVQTLRRAWQLAGEGRSAGEAGVIVVRNSDGTYDARLVFDPKNILQVKLEIGPEAVAILHTHPNNTGREPSPQDRKNSDLLGIPTFTMTDRGLWVYDPKTRETSEVMLRLSWLNPKNWKKQGTGNNS